MKCLNIFLRALEKTLGFKDKFFVPLTSTTSNKKFPAIKEMKVEVHCIDGNYNETISTVIENFNSSQQTIEEIEDKVIQSTIENILKFYGI